MIEEIERRGYDIACVAGCSMGAVIGGIYAAGKLDEYRNWIESLDYLDVLRLVDVSFRLGAIRGDKVFGQIRKIVGEINIEQLRIPYTAVAADLTNQQEIWFQEGCLHQAMRASAAIPSLFTPVMQGNRMLVDGGILNPLPIVPVVSSHCDLIIAVNLNATNQKQYQLPVIERPAAFKMRFDALLSSLGSRLPFRRKPAEELIRIEKEIVAEGLAPPSPWLADSADPENQQPAAAPEREGAPKSATGSFIIDNVGPASLLDLINQSFEVMQTSLAQYKIAGYPPDVLINVPKRVCRFFEFYKAPELIALGREIARDTLDSYEGVKR
ncbi:patatin [Pseudomonas putida ND6]|uniref:Patatin n=1 Tax=Pseudomonas putida ND6 TaxID=231023 RepID=I3UPL7_PSEPU|nr:patatin [Pseudomonas putida ND6]